MEHNGVHAPVRAMDRIKRAYPTAPQRLLVPEFPDEQGNPLELFYYPKTGVDEQKIDVREPKDQTERMILTLILKAMDDQGKPLFQWGEARMLMQYVPMDVLARIYLIMIGARPNGTPTLDEVKRDIQGDPTSSSDSTLAPSSTSP